MAVRKRKTEKERGGKKIRVQGYGKWAWMYKDVITDSTGRFRFHRSTLKTMVRNWELLNKENVAYIASITGVNIVFYRFFMRDQPDMPPELQIGCYRFHTEDVRKVLNWIRA